jgi:DNA-binding NarL/FixJ family response regulator
MKHVLIVDDSPSIRQRLIALLAESPRIRIVGEAGNSRQAWDTMTRVQPDTVILDIRIPGENGIELLKQIKARYPGMKVIMLTNFDYSTYRRQCRQLGADHFLNKTMEFEKILDTILEDKDTEEKLAMSSEGKKGEGLCPKR